MVLMELIKTNEELVDVCKSISKEKFITIDTEFIREKNADKMKMSIPGIRSLSDFEPKIFELYFFLSSKFAPTWSA